MNSINRKSSTIGPPSNKRRRVSLLDDRVKNNSVTCIREPTKGNQKKLLDELHRLRSENSRLVTKERADALTISQLSSENTQLLQKCSAYRISKQTLKKQKAESQLLLQDSQAEIDTLKEKKKSLMQKLKDARAKIQDLQQYAVASDQSLEDSNKEHQILQDKNKELETKLESVTACVSDLRSENVALLKKYKEEQHAKEKLQIAKAAIQEQQYSSQEALDLVRMDLEVAKSEIQSIRVHYDNASRTIQHLEHCVHERDGYIRNLQARSDHKLRGLQAQSNKSLFHNQELQRKVGELEGLLAHNALERDELERQVIKQQEKTVIFKSEVENQLRTTLQQQRDALKQVTAKVEKGAEKESIEDLIRDKKELKRIVADLKAKHGEEVEELQEEIEQMKMNHALELGFVEG